MIRQARVLRETWEREAGEAVLEIIRVDAIARTPGRKTQEFTFEFFPEIDTGP